ncbi:MULTISPECIES: DNA circularization protein [Pseudomonas]|uniref:DNA circularization protein n=1 Tax=Pseudomonas guariconensis TaxID=1288410 RepID=UPI0020980F8A|nr:MULTISPECIES: DNA circularization N-terminal domain-containing protein [Pseudomonas]MCO7594275.1 DNA circularization N-terminal domain-containing protein [Pseudomonas guariconensis]MCU7219998.1 DNA circularization N-terminal domain-containing protein [Pseudomonas brassicacearum]
MSEWRDLRREASFRGVPFWVDSDSVPVGRRTQLHEYPKRDQPLVEDMGRRTREYKFVGFIIGADFISQRDRLLAALDQPGPGELVHPWFGRLTVTAGDCDIAHARNELGMVRFNLTFIDGMLMFPVQRVNTRRQLAAHVPTLLESAKARFDAAMAKVDLARQRVNAVRRALSSAYAFAINFLKPLTSLAGDLGALVQSVINAPGALAASLLSDIASVERWFSGYGSSGSLQSSRSRARAISALSAEPPVADDPEVAAIQAAVIGLIQDAALVDLLLDMVEVPVASVQSVDQPAALSVQLEQDGSTVEAGSVMDTGVPVADDILALRDAISEAMWAIAGDSLPEHFGVLSDARLALDRHLTEVARSGVWLRPYQPRTTVSSLVLAHRLYGDALRGAEIVSRNAIRHPGFVPATELQVAKS